MCENPICEVCKNPMQEVETIEAEKEGSKFHIRVYTCFKDKTFSRIEEA